MNSVFNLDVLAFCRRPPGRGLQREETQRRVQARRRGVCCRNNKPARPSRRPLAARARGTAPAGQADEAVVGVGGDEDAADAIYVLRGDIFISDLTRCRSCERR